MTTNQQDAMSSMKDDLIGRLRHEVVLKQYPPITLIIEGKETTCDGGQIVSARNPDGAEDEIERLRAEAELKDAEITQLRSILGEVHALFEDGIAGVDHRGFQKQGEAARYTRVLMKLCSHRLEEHYDCRNLG